MSKRRPGLVFASIALAGGGYGATWVGGIFFMLYQLGASSKNSVIIGGSLGALAGSLLSFSLAWSGRNKEEEYARSFNAEHPHINNPWIGCIDTSVQKNGPPGPAP